MPRAYGDGRRRGKPGDARVEPTRSFKWPLRCVHSDAAGRCPLGATPGTERCGPHHRARRLRHDLLVRRVCALLLPVVPDVLSWFVERGTPEERSAAFQALADLSDAAARAPELSPRARLGREEDLRLGFDPPPGFLDDLVRANFGSLDAVDPRGLRAHLKRALLAVSLACSDGAPPVSND